MKRLIAAIALLMVIGCGMVEPLNSGGEPQPQPSVMPTPGGHP